MMTVQARMEVVRSILRSGRSPQPGAAALLEAATGEEVLLPKGPSKMPWKTTRVELKEAEKEFERARAERLTALQRLVSNESQVFDVVKQDRNLSPKICVGRAQRNDIVLADATISSVHAHIDDPAGNDHHYLSDGDSSNGTFVNHKPLLPGQSVALRNGDCIRFGKRVFYYLVGERFTQFLEMRLVRQQ